MRDQLSRERRELPWELVEKPYTFQGEHGTPTLGDLFAGRGQLVIYHAMFHPETAGPQTPPRRSARRSPSTAESRDIQCALSDCDVERRLRRGGSAHRVEEPEGPKAVNMDAMFNFLEA
jgi:predicted dithiol-disulfide oxidoreductase (DUF899 family)